MKRPLCVFCFAALLTQLAFAFLPQAVRLPLAAFFVLLCAVLLPCMARKELKLHRAGATALCVLLGLAVGAGSCARTVRQTERLQECHAGRELFVIARVEQVQPSYWPGRVRARLFIERAGGEKAAFRCDCAALPACEAGDRVSGCLTFAVPEPDERLGLYADGVFLTAEADEGVVRNGKAGGIRAAAHRLQQRLSDSLCRELDEESGGVLAAMTLGDRSRMPASLRAAYRAAGLSHVLVVSGMHVSILCGGLLSGAGRLLSRRKEWRQRYLSRVGQALAGAVLAAVLVCITGFTPSVLRASTAVWVSALGIVLILPPDALTSLGIAGLWMTMNNCYAACDMGFELSFAAVIGAILGGELAEAVLSVPFCKKRLAQMPLRRRKKESVRKYLRRRVRALPLSLLVGLTEAVCVSLCASAATMPVLLLWGMAVSPYALVSSAAVLWFVPFLLICGVGGALFGLLPLLHPLYRLFAGGGMLAAGVLNRWAVWVSGWPGAERYFETECALLLGIGLSLLWLWAVGGRVRLRISVPVTGLLIGIGVLLCVSGERDVTTITLTGSSRSPNVVISEAGEAVVVLRGGNAEQLAVERVLERRGVRTVSLLIDLRTDPEKPCSLAAEQTLRPAPDALYRTARAAAQGVEAELLPLQSGAVLRLCVNGVQLVMLRGTVKLAEPLKTDLLLASGSSPASVRYAQALSLGEGYGWMEGEGYDPARTITGEAGMSLKIRRDGSVRLSKISF